LARSLKSGCNAQQDLRKLSLAVERSPMVVMITDAAGIIVNPKFTKITGYSVGDAVGKQAQHAQIRGRASRIARRLSPAGEKLSSGM
jgi:PAS domain S-box-containing protein